MCFFYARDGGCPRWGPEMGSGTSAIDGVRHFARYGVRHFARDGVRHLCQIRGQALYPRWGQTPLPEMGSGTSVRDGVRHLCPRWGLTPSGIVSYLHLRFILRCFIIVGAGDSINIA